MTTISFNIPSNYLCNEEYNSEQLSGIAKNLFLKWYNEQYLNKFSIDELDTKITNGMEPIINNLFNISKSNKKGKYFENIIEKTFKKYKNIQYSDTSLNDHSGDGLIFINGKKCIIEMKNYSSAVPESQIDKLKYDMRCTNIKYGIIFSTSTISNRNSFDFEYVDDCIIIFIANYFDNPEFIDLAIKILQFCIYEDNDFNICKQYLLKINNAISEIDKLKNDFLLMEKTINTNLNNFYILLRNYECSMKILIHNLLNTFKNNDEIILEKYSNSLLEKLYSKLQKKGFVLIEEKELFLCKNGMKIFNLKIKKDKINVIHIYPEISTCITIDNFPLVMKLINKLIV